MSPAAISSSTPVARALLELLSAAGGGGGVFSTALSTGPGLAVVVLIAGFSEPTPLSVPASRQVTIVFMNKDSVEHSITFDDNSKSVDADAGQRQMLTFTAPANGTTISFHCKYHPTQMKGTITLGSAGGAGGLGSSTSSSSSGY